MGRDGISFTGSVSVGEKIMRDGADTMKRITLELGGKSPTIASGEITSNYLNTNHSGTDCNPPMFRCRIRWRLRHLRAGVGWHWGLDVSPVVEGLCVARIASL